MTRQSSHHELRADHRREQRVFWKGVVALAVTVVVAVLRQRYWV